MQEILDIIACPRCRRGLESKGDFLSCGPCGIAFPVLEGKVPNLLEEDAWKLEEAKESGFKHSLRL